MQTAKQRGADVLLINEPYKWSGNSAWNQDASRRDGILMCNSDYSIGDILETDAKFVRVEVAGVQVYICYSSPNNPLEVFETQILLLEKSLSEAIGGPSLRVTLTASRPRGEKSAWIGGEYWWVRWSPETT